MYVRRLFLGGVGLRGGESWRVYLLAIDNLIGKKAWAGSAMNVCMHVRHL